MKDLMYFQNKIQGMNFMPVNDDELAVILEKDKKAVDNARLEGLYRSDDEQEFFDLLNKLRVPLHLRRDLVKEWVESII